jgi:excinuclease UvrABC nuclease subunit
MKSTENIVKECLLTTEELILQIGKRFNKFKVKNMTLNEDGSPRDGDNFLDELDNISKSGIYAFENPDGIISYVGKGGTGEKTLRYRISQELRLYDKKSHQAGTLSKNIQEKDGIPFTDKIEWKKYISNWNIRIVHQENWNVSINVIEPFIIEVINPRYNIDK